MPTRQELIVGPISVIFGGKSAEREVSLETGRAIAKALSDRGYPVKMLDASGNLLKDLLQINPVAAVVALHGRYGEDGCVQGLLECAEIPYTGSGVLASALSMNKALSKRIATSFGVNTPDSVLINSEEFRHNSTIELHFEMPVMVKPSSEGSSVGISLVHNKSELFSAIEPLEGAIIVERYIQGRELSVAILDGDVLGAIEVVTERAFYDYEAKYDPNSGTRYIYPAPMSDILSDRLFNAAKKIFDAHGCSGVCRLDFMIDQEDEPWYIEINTLPGMTQRSLVPKVAEGIGICFEELCERLLMGARLKA